MGTTRAQNGVIGAIWAIAVVIAALLYAPAALTQAPPELNRFPEGATGGQEAGQLRGPEAIATSGSTGSVYISESGNNRISEFTFGGAFIKAWGWGVVASGPDNHPQNEVQELVLTATAGTFSLQFFNPLADGAARKQQTASISFDATAGEVQAALEALESPAPGDIQVSGSAGGPWTIEYVGKYADTDVAPLGIDAAALTGTAEVKTLQGGGAFEICDPAAGDTCRAGQFGGASPGEFLGRQRGLAVGPDGSVYVMEQEFDPPGPNSRIEKFDSNGNFQLMIGGEVDKTTHADLCTVQDVESGDVCGAGNPGGGLGEFEFELGEFNSESPGEEESRLAIGPNGDLYVGDKERIEIFEPDGDPVGQLSVSGFVRGLTVDASGNLYVSFAGRANVTKLTSAGLPATPASFSVSNPSGLALDASGDLYVIQNPPGAGTPAISPRVVEFDPLGNKLIPSAEEELHKEYFAQKGTSASLTGLATLLCDSGSGNGALYVIDLTNHVSSYGEDPQCASIPRPPRIVSRYVSHADQHSATVVAEINPRLSSTTYFVEYGTEPCESSSCDQQPSSPGQELEDEGSSPVRREVELTGLEAGTTYHYRVVAIGDATTVVGEEGTFTTRREGAGGLPDDRAYEMVSPTEKNSGDIASTGGTNAPLVQSSANGDDLLYPSYTPFADPQAAPPSSAYRATRGEDGWATENISPRGAALEQQVKAVSPDLTKAAIVSSEPPLCCSAVNGIKNLYIRNNESGAYSLITGSEPRLAISKGSYCVAIQGFTPDFERIFFKANGALTDDAPDGEGWSLYEWTAASGIKLVSVLPGGIAAPPYQATSYGAAYGSGNLGCTAEGILSSAISVAGDSAVWTLSEPDTPEKILYDRIDGTETVQLDASEGGSGPSGGGQFWGASADGSKVVFSAAGKLVPGAHGNDLYLYDLNAPPGSHLTDISEGPESANVQGVVGVSESGNAAYFVASGVVAENDGAAVEPDGAPEHAKKGANNLYVWRQGEPLRFIARLSSVANAADPMSDASNWGISPAGRTGSVSSSGDQLALTSVEPLTGYENIAQGSGEVMRETFLYDAAQNELSCVSCNPTGARPLPSPKPITSASEQAALTDWKTPFSQPRVLSADGDRLFFESFDSLSEADTNGLRDVYEFEREGIGTCEAASPSFSPQAGGCIALISSGEPEAGNAFFLDASESGNDVFISTPAPLVKADQDEKYDAYDARVEGGGFPELPEEPIPCDGAQSPCRAAPSAPPTSTQPTSNPPVGEGNLPPTCQKGKVLSKGRCVSKHHKHRKRSHRKRHGKGKHHTKHAHGGRDK